MYASRTPGKSFPLSLRQRNTCALCWPWRPARVRTLQDKAERLMATNGHLFEEMMATYHSLGIAGNYEEDETVLRETLENLGCSRSAERHMSMVSLENLGRSRSAEKHMRIVSAMDRLVAATGHILRGCDGHLSSTSYC